MRFYISCMLLVLLVPGAGATEVQRRTANDGQLILEDIPEIPRSLPHTLARYQDIHTTHLVGWSKDSKQIFIRTQTGDVTQLHRVEKPRGDRHQLTFGEEPVGEVLLQPGSDLMALTRDEGGDEFDQIFLLDTQNGQLTPLSEGQDLNNRMAWDRQGRRLAYRSTRRNGRSSDIWVQDIEAGTPATILLKTDDGALWKPIDFSRDGKKLLIQQFLSVIDSRIYIKDLPDGELQLLAGDAENPSSNIATGFSSDDTSVLFVTNQRNGAAELAKTYLDGVTATAFISAASFWDITQFVLSQDRSRGAFISNEAGISKLYLFDPDRFTYKAARRMPDGLISGLVFSPDGRKLGMTLNSARNPNDAFVLTLGRKPLSSGKLRRWTYSEVEGLETRKFVKPVQITYPSPSEETDTVIPTPAFVYLPRGRGPFPVIIHVHGGPENQFRPRFNPKFQMWIDQLGVAIIAPNIRGSLGYGSRYITLDDGYRREAAIKDIGALLDWIGEQKQLDEDRVAIVGASYGGYVALASAVHYSDRLRAAVDRFGISNFVTFLENTQDYRREMRRLEYGDERDPEMRAFLQRISPLNNVERIKIPLFVQQGRNDPIVPTSESDQLVKALREQGQTVWYMNALNEGHNYARKENRDLFQQATFLFLQKYLLGKE
ncbi:MAG: alpha/beta fold hydrolase [Xanthomonadales bacterium]|nr:alpha/beta fold hydrolase [Xanthomonadales bacterium]